MVGGLGAGCSRLLFFWILLHAKKMVPAGYPVGLLPFSQDMLKPSAAGGFCHEQGVPKNTP